MPPADPKADRDAALRKQAERRGAIEQQRAEVKEKRLAEGAGKEALVREDIAKEEKFAEEHETRLREFKKQEDARKAEIAEHQRRKKEEEDRLLERKKKEKEETEQHKIYLEDMHKASVLRMRVEQRKKKSIDTEMEMRRAADAEAYRLKQTIDTLERTETRRIEEAARKKRGSIDIAERSGKEEARETARQERAKLDMQERSAVQMLEQELQRKSMDLQRLPPPMRQQEEARMAMDERTRKAKITGDFSRKRSQIEVESRQAISAIEVKAKRERDATSSEERTELTKLHTEIQQARQQADHDCKHKHEEAVKTADEILHDLSTGEDLNAKGDAVMRKSAL